jgi:hypothetical protein
MPESIYNLVAEETPEVRLEPKTHRSKKSSEHTDVPGSTFGCHGSSRLPGAGKVTKKGGAMFGPHKTLSPTSSVQVNAPSTGGNTKGQFSYPASSRPPLPSKSEVPVYGIRTDKNFVTANAVEAILQVPKSTVDVNLNYLEKEDYGKVPAYLTNVKEEVKRENEMIDKYVREQMGVVDMEEDVFDPMSEEERSELLFALKKKWDEVNAKYQKITHLVQLDTAGQIRRKEHLEKALKELETDIARLSKPGPVLLRRE